MDNKPIAIGTDDFKEIIETGSLFIDKTLFIKELIDNLEVRDREIILLRFYKEKTQSEVAKILGITQVQVSRTERKILEKMRKKLTYQLF